MSTRVLDVSGDRASDFIKERIAAVPELLAEVFVLEGVSLKDAKDYFALVLFSPDDSVVRIARRSEARTKLTNVAKKIYGRDFKEKLSESVISKCEAEPAPGTFRIAYFLENQHEGGCGSAVLMLDDGEVAGMFETHGALIRKFNEAWPRVVERAKKVVIPPSNSTANNIEATLMAASYVFDEVTRVGSDAAAVAYLVGLHARGDKTVRLLVDRMNGSLRGMSYSNELQDFGAAWMKVGFPKLEIGHKLAASLAMTDVPDDIEVLAPWKAWSLVIPPGLLSDQTDAVTTARCWCVGSEIRFLVSSNGEIVGPVDRAYLLRENTPSPVGRNLCIALDSLVRSVCLALANPSEYKKNTSKDRSSQKNTNREPGVPDFSVSRFMLSAPVQIDVRQHLLDFIGGKRRPSGGGSLTVQHFVRGHWRNQAHGPRMSLRKQMRIEGYWKGPEHGAIKLGNYKVKNEDERNHDVSE